MKLFTRKWLLRYEFAITGNIWDSGIEHGSLAYWKNKLFFIFLKYCWPFSLIALIPGVMMSFKAGLPIVAAIDLGCFCLIVFATFARIALKARKYIVIITFYILAVFLINMVGYVGPGVFYLFVLTVLTALFFSVNQAYKTIAINTFLLAGFAGVIHFKLFNSALSKTYSADSWLACSSNLIFLSLVIVALIDRIFIGLQKTIFHKDQLQERYKGIFDGSPLPMWVFDTDTFKFLDVNDAAVRHYGYTKQEFLSMLIFDIRPLEDKVNTQRIVAANKISKTFYSGKAQHIKKSGETIYVNIQSNAVDLDGHNARLVLATDITEQLENELEIFNSGLRIQESEANLRAIFDNSEEGFVLLDEHYLIKTFNEKAKDYIRLNDFQTEFEPGKLIFDFIEKNTYESFKHLLQKAYRGDAVNYYKQYTCASGEVTYIDFTLTPVYENERITGTCITGRDITKSKIYLQTIEEQNNRFKEISWMQSHLVRAPLARIMGLTELLTHTNSDNEHEEVLNYLQQSSKELDYVIKEITQKSNNLLTEEPVKK